MIGSTVFRRTIAEELLEDERIEQGFPPCRGCGCNDDWPCHTLEGPCKWIEADLCSKCVPGELDPALWDWCLIPRGTP